jgi:hypothetical protein
LKIARAVLIESPGSPRKEVWRGQQKRCMNGTISRPLRRSSAISVASATPRPSIAASMARLDSEEWEHRAVAELEGYFENFDNSAFALPFRTHQLIDRVTRTRVIEQQDCPMLDWTSAANGALL